MQNHGERGRVEIPAGVKKNVCNLLIEKDCQNNLHGISIANSEHGILGKKMSGESCDYHGNEALLVKLLDMENLVIKAVWNSLLCR